MPYFPLGVDTASHTEQCCWSQLVAHGSAYVTAVIRVAPDNVHSHEVPKDAGFVSPGVIESPDQGRLVRYEKTLRKL
jgi:hypothetical protein